MKTTTTRLPSQLLLSLTRHGAFLVALLLLAVGAMSAVAQTPDYRNSTAGDLTSGSDWESGVAPGSTNIAVWESPNVTGADTEPLGADTTWDGIQILTPGGPVTITGDGNYLTNGTGGINLMQAGQGLTMSNNVTLNGPQYWQVGNNQTLDFAGGMQRNVGSAIFFSFDNSANAAAYIQTAPWLTNASGTLLFTNNILTNNNIAICQPNAGGTIGIGTGDAVPIATYNDIDYAALNQNDQVVPLASIGYSEEYGGVPIYSSNPSGSTPTESGGSATLFYDCTNNTDYGIRINTTTYVLGMRFNTPQMTNTFLYNTLDAWQVLFKSGNTLDANSFLVTTNTGTSPVVVTSGGTVRISTLSTTGGTEEMLIYQNNPAANLIINGDTVSQRNGPAYVSKFGAGTFELQDVSATYTAGTLIYGGTLLVDLGTTMDAPVTVYSDGNFEGGSSAAANSQAISVNSGGSAGVYVTAPNGQYVNNGNLTFGSGTTALQFIYSNTVAASTTAAPLVMTNSSGVLTSSNTVNVNVLCSSLAVGQYPLIKYTASLGGNGFSALNLNLLPPQTSGYLSNNTANSSVDLVITNVDDPITWSATGGSGAWDVSQTANWTGAQGGTTTYQRSGPYAGPVVALGDNVIFNDSATGPSITVTLNTNVSPGSVTVNNSANTYTISGNGSIGGIGSFTKSGSGTLTLSTTNAFSGGVFLNGGAVIFNNLDALGGPNCIAPDSITFNGGTLQYNGNSDDISTRTVTFASGGAAINTAGQDVNYANPVGHGGAGGLTKTGTGTLTLNGVQTYQGNTIVSQGTLALGTNTDLTNSAVVIVDGGAVLDLSLDDTNLTLDGNVNQALEGGGQVNALVTVPLSALVSPSGGNGDTTTLDINGGFAVSGGTLVMDIAGNGTSVTSNDVISVTGNLDISGGNLVLNVNGSLPLGSYPLIKYTGTLTGSPSSLDLSGFNQTGAIATLSASGGEVYLVISVGASDSLTWSGTGDVWSLTAGDDWLNVSTPWAYTNGDTVTFNDAGGVEPTVELSGTLIPSGITVSNTATPVYTFANGTGGALLDGNFSSYLNKEGTGTLIVEVPSDTAGPTTISQGTLQIGGGSSAPLGDISEGSVTNNGALVFAQADGATHLVRGVVSGTGTLTVNATATIALTNNNTYSGATTISNGTLQVGGGPAAGSLGTDLSVTDNGSLVFDRGGTFTEDYNVSGSGSFGSVGGGVVTVSGTLAYLGDTIISSGTIKLTANNQLPSTNSVAGSIGVLNMGGTTNGTLDLNGNNVTINAMVATNLFNGTITNSSTTTATTNTLLDLTTTNETFDGLIKDHGSSGAKTLLYVAGGGTLTLDPTNESLWSGGMLISNSTVSLGTGDINADALAAGTGPITLVGTNTTLVLAGGQTGANEGNTYNPGTNTISVPAGQTATIWGPPRGVIGNNLTGAGTVYYHTTYVRGGVNGNWAGFSGAIIVAGDSTGGNWGFGLTNGLPLATLIMNSNVTFYAGSDYGGTYNNGNWPSGVPFQIGALEGGSNSACVVAGASTGNAGGANVNFEIGGLNANCTYSGGTTTDPIGILKVGTGTFTLNSGGFFRTNITESPSGFGEETNIGYGGTNEVIYTGDTTISNGVLALDAPVNLTNSAVVTIASPNAVLDASAMGYITDLSYTLPDGATNEPVTNSIFEVGTNTLAGIGTLNGILQADPTSTFNVGLPTGVFNVTGSAILAGAINMNIIDTNANLNSELAAASITISNTATLVITNIGPELTNGVTFTLFNHPVSGFASVTLPEGTYNYQWQNNLAANGTITLITNGLAAAPPVNPNPTNIVTSVSAGNLILSWPADHTGWYLQVQSNPLTIGISNDWVTVSGSSSTNQVVVPLNAASGAVFYRLVYTNTP